jgi:membrane protease YdiL (CAAX protease family)
LEPSVSKLLRRHYSRIGIACFTFLAAALAAQFLIVFVMSFLAPRAVQEGWFLTALSFVSLYLVGFPLFVLILPKAPAELPEQRDLGGFGELMICLLMCMGILYPLNFLGQWVTELLSGILGGSGESMLDNLLGSMDLWSVTLFAVILAPIMEELAFRKLLLDRMRTIDRSGAILFSALVFGLFHGNAGQFFYAFGVGILFGCIYTRTGRVRYTIVLHILVNAIGSLVPLLLTRDIPDLENLADRGIEAWPEILENLPAYLALGAFGLVILCAVVAGIILIIRRFPRLLERSPEDRLTSPTLAFRTQFLNGGFIAFLLAAALEMVAGVVLG